MTRVRMDVPFCEKQIALASAGDGKALHRLVEHLWPAWLDLIRASRSMGRFAGSEDDVRNVALRLMEKLSGEARALRLYRQWQEKHSGKNIEDWMRIVTANAVRDYVREQLGPRKADDGVPSAKRLLNEFASRAQTREEGFRPPFTRTQMAKQLMEFAQTRLSNEQIGALRLWLEGATPSEMANELGVGSETAQRALRSGIAVLRRHFTDAAEIGQKGKVRA
jgi:DNA-directed RNA polymerase specialized sigma24 family protein